jgi:hypothetical protein
MSLLPLDGAVEREPLEGRLALEPNRLVVPRSGPRLVMVLLPAPPLAPAPDPPAELRALDNALELLKPEPPADEEEEEEEEEPEDEPEPPDPEPPPPPPPLLPPRPRPLRLPRSRGAIMAAKRSAETVPLSRIVRCRSATTIGAVGTAAAVGVPGAGPWERPFRYQAMPAAATTNTSASQSRRGRLGRRGTICGPGNIRGAGAPAPVAGFGMEALLIWCCIVFYSPPDRASPDQS